MARRLDPSKVELVELGKDGRRSHGENSSPVEAQEPDSRQDHDRLLEGNSDGHARRRTAAFFDFCTVNRRHSHGVALRQRSAEERRSRRQKKNLPLRWASKSDYSMDFPV